MKVCEFIADFIVKHANGDVFAFPGGGNKFLIMGLANNPKINAYFCHHEQAVAMSAVGYSKYKNDVSFAVVTTGCGGTNTITGVLNAWNDSAPCIFISGQCHSKQIISSLKTPIRQLGIQEADIVSIVTPITKYAKTIENAEDIVYELEKALYIAKEGRMGPVWLDIPLDFQGMEINESELLGFSANEYISQYKKEINLADVNFAYELISKSEKPVVLAGQGIKQANAQEEFKSFIQKFDIPVVATKLGMESIETTNDLFIGNVGNHGSKAGNKVMQSADLLIVLGSRLGINAVGYSYDLFVPNGKVLVIDIDENEHKKNTVHVDYFIHGDLIDFLRKICKYEGKTHTSWCELCKEYKANLNIITKEKYDTSKGISLYAFVNELSSKIPKDGCICTDAGSAFLVTSQVLTRKNITQRYITSGGQAEMGFAIPCAVGASIASNGNKVYVVTGDGSSMLNIQELMTISHYNLPIKIFILNNNGYMGIRQMEEGMGVKKIIGTDKSNSLSFPKFDMLATAFGIDYKKIESFEDLSQGIEESFNSNNSCLYEIICNPSEQLIAASTKTFPDGSKKQVLDAMIP